MNAVEKIWFGARSFFEIFVGKGPAKIEERIILVLAEDFDAAIIRADEHFLKYARENGIGYSRDINVFELEHFPASCGDEVYSRVCAPEDWEQLSDFMFD